MALDFLSCRKGECKYNVGILPEKIMNAVCPARHIKRYICGLILIICAWPGFAIVVSPPAVTKSFSAAQVGLNQSVTLTFTITNPNPATDLTGVNMNDNLPAGLIIANPDSMVGSC